MPKHQIPTSKHQRNTKHQTPILGNASRGLALGVWSFTGAWCLVFGAFLGLVTPHLIAQSTPHIGYVYPAGGEIGETFQVTVGGQFLDGVTNAFVSGDGVRVEVVDFNKPMPQGLFNELRDKFRALQDRKQAARRDRDSTNVWTTADEKELTSIREKMLKNPPNRQGTPAIAETATLKVTVTTNAAPGDHELRLGTPTGLSNPMVFLVGKLREYSAMPAKAPNPEADRFRERFGQAPTTATAKSDLRVSLPAVVNGQIMPGEVDRIHFTARKGQRLVVQASARALIPYLADAVPGWFQATVALLDAKGNELAYADDFRFNPDPAFRYEIARDGEYTIEIKDAIYRGREDFVYRLTIGELPFVTGVFPLGGRVGVSTPVEFKGWNLSAASATQANRFAEPGVYQLAVTNGEYVSNPIPFAVDDLPELLESEPNSTSQKSQRVTLPLIVNGRISKSGDVDVFSFEGQAGGEIVAEVTARRLGSPLDSQLRLTDAAGKLLAFNDDTEDKGAGLETHHADSYLRAKLPARGVYFLAVSDTQHQGGDEFAYRLRLSVPRPDFALRVAPSSLSVRAGVSVPLTVFALRKDGFTNAIALSLDEAPKGYVLDGGGIPANQDRVRVTLTVPPNPTKQPASITLVGQARLRGELVSRPVVPCDDLMQAFIYRHLVPARELNVAVTGRFAPRAPARIIAAAPLKIPAGGTVKCQVFLPAARLADDLRLELDEPPEGVTIQKVAVERDGAEILLTADSAKAKPGTSGNLIVNAFLNRAAAKDRPQANRRREPIGALPAIPFEVVAP